MINFRTLFFLFFVCFSSDFYAQYNGLGFIYPLDREVVVTGNYGEIRPNHFHAGLDFSTDPSLNLPIKSVADGYVSRIKIGSGGYGRVLYVTHTNGYVSVYAHQKKYAQKIDEYIKKLQLEQKKNEIEVYPKANELSVKKGEVIGYTGNSGSSTGPHLHFEIREEKSEIPINPLLVYDVKDDVKPELTHLAIYSTADTNNIKRISSVPVKYIGDKLSLPKYTQVLTENTFAIGFAGFDRANGSTNKNNIYEAKVLLDDKIIYHHQLNNISFDNGRYVNVFSEKEGGVKFQKCFSPTCYDIAIYKSLINGGKIVLNDTLSHKISLQINDEKGNKNALTFFVKTKNLKGYAVNTIKHNVFCNQDANIKKEDVEVFIKAGTLSANASVGVYINKLGKAVVGNKDEDLLKAFTLSIKIPKAIPGKENKMVLINEGHCMVGTYENGWLKAESKSFGIFSYGYDTVAPTIVIPSSKKKASTSSIKFKVADNLSGIADYHIYVNGVWQIAEYDAKSATISCNFSEANPKTLKIEVTDKVGNKAVLNREL
ncbi:MAG: M23 family metallopeptidase [Bacteroidetes bacterium]|nr:M23 family metallopeptidase [Bacteroidota bacterium]